MCLGSVGLDPMTSTDVADSSDWTILAFVVVKGAFGPVLSPSKNPFNQIENLNCQCGIWHAASVVRGPMIIARLALRRPCALQCGMTE
jgi:hypothetical protein